MLLLVVPYRMYGDLLTGCTFTGCTVLDWENSQHITMRHLVSLWNDICGASGINIPLSWWYICLETRLISGIFAWKWGSMANNEQTKWHSELSENEKTWYLSLSSTIVLFESSILGLQNLHLCPPWVGELKSSSLVFSCKQLFFRFSILACYRGIVVEACVAEWWTPRTLDLEVWGSNLAHRIVSSNKELYSTLSLFTQVYKWVPATYCWRGNPAMD